MPGEGLEPPTNGLQNRCSTAELTRQIKDLADLDSVFATGLPPEIAPNCSHSVRIFGKRRLHDLRRPCVVVREQVAVYTQGNGRGSVAQAAADGQDIYAGGDDLRHVRMA